MTELEVAVKRMIEGNYTCVLTDGAHFYTSRERGVKPLVQLLSSGDIPSGLVAADRVVGKGAAFLYVLLGVRAVYASVISSSAASVLREHGIIVSHDTLVEAIKNRTGDGVCPFEAAVMNVDNAENAYTVILKKMKEMKIDL